MRSRTPMSTPEMPTGSMRASTSVAWFLRTRQRRSRLAKLDSLWRVLPQARFPRQRWQLVRVVQRHGRRVLSSILLLLSLQLRHLLLLLLHRELLRMGVGSRGKLSRRRRHAGPFQEANSSTCPLVLFISRQLRRSCWAQRATGHAL